MGSTIVHDRGAVCGLWVFGAWRRMVLLLEVYQVAVSLGRTAQLRGLRRGAVLGNRARDGV